MWGGGGGGGGKEVWCMEWREEGWCVRKGDSVCSPREKNHILNQIKAMFVQVRAAVNQINNHMYT